MNQHVRIALMCSAAWLSLNPNPGWAEGYPAPMTNPTVSDNCGNTAGGTKALFNNNIPCNPLLANTAFGYNALTSNIGGTDNTAVGGGALYFNSTGVYDTAIGAGALLNNIASYNTATGAGTTFRKLLNGLRRTAVSFRPKAGCWRHWRRSLVRGS